MPKPTFTSASPQMQNSSFPESKLSLSESTQDFSLLLPFEHTYLDLPLNFKHQKDISITQFIDDDGLRKYYMILSVNDRDDQKEWKMHCLISNSLQDKWTHHGEVTVNGIIGDEVCAAGVDTNSLGNIELFVQTRCFGEGGSIVHATTNDGLIYHNAQKILDSSPNSFRSNVYDAEPTTITNSDGTVGKYFTVTCVGHYKQGCAKDGGIYLAKQNVTTALWDVFPTPLFTEDTLPPHASTLNGGEWVPEGGKLLQVQQDKFLFYGTCFRDSCSGTRQRGFFAIANAIQGPFTFLGTVDPVARQGETGHGTILLDEDAVGATTIELFYQARTYTKRSRTSGNWTSERRSYRLEDFLALEKLRNDMTLLQPIQ